jgi:adenylylsulfate kinase
VEKVLSIWFTGLPCAGKTTLAKGLEQKLKSAGYPCMLLDGDEIRRGLTSDLGFSMEHRRENIRRVSEVSKLFLQNKIITLCSFIAPTIAIRSMAKEIIGEETFIEIFVDTPLEECERRDTKGMYAKARARQIQGFTGISSPWEPPLNPNLAVQTTNQTIEQCIDKIHQYILHELH